MYRFLLTPRWWGITLFALVAIPVCLFMGSWQLSRFQARVDTDHAQRKAASQESHATPRPLDRLLPVDLNTSGRVAEATGRYDTGHQLLVPDRQLGDATGSYVLTMLRTPGGKALPVVRGWLPGRPDPARVPAPPRGRVTVNGALQASESPGSPGVNAAGALPHGQIAMISAASLVNVVPYDVYDAWITVQHIPAGSPLKPVPPAHPDNSGLDMKAFQNLGYTGEWFVFAGFVVFMWFRFFRRDAELARDVALGLAPGPDEGPKPDDRAPGDQGPGPGADPGPGPGADPGMPAARPAPDDRPAPPGTAAQPDTPLGTEHGTGPGAESGARSGGSASPGRPEVAENRVQAGGEPGGGAPDPGGAGSGGAATDRPQGRPSEGGRDRVGR